LAGLLSGEAIRLYLQQSQFADPQFTSSRIDKVRHGG
jgi:hypothetical protein